MLAALGFAALAARDSGETAAPAPLGNAAVVHTPGARLGAVWAFRPRNLPELAGKASSVALASVTNVADGPPLRGDEPDDVMPTQRISFKVEDRWAGSSPSEFVLFKTGSNRNWIEDDPPYSVGEKYLMFVSPRPEDPGTYLPVAPDGRIKLIGGNLRPLIEGAVAASLGGRATAEAKQLTVAARGGK
jgi:hypothetical protein